jgi:hypothetical protein
MPVSNGEPEMFGHCFRANPLFLVVEPESEGIPAVLAFVPDLFSDLGKVLVQHIIPSSLELNGSIGGCEGATNGEPSEAVGTWLVVGIVPGWGDTRPSVVQK